jgi:hypothetical protein
VGELDPIDIDRAAVEQVESFRFLNDESLRT